MRRSFHPIAGREASIITVLAGVSLSRAFLKAQLAAADGFATDSSDVTFQPQAGTVTSTVTGHRVRRSGKSGRLTFTLRSIEAPRAIGATFARCHPPPPVVACDTDRNCTGNALNLLAPNKIPDLGALGQAALAGLFVSRIAIPKDADDPDAVARALDFSYERFTLKDEAEHDSRIALAEGSPVQRERCAVIKGTSAVTIAPGHDPEPRFTVAGFDFRDPSVRWLPGDRYTALSRQSATSRVRFDVSSIQNGGLIAVRLRARVTDDDGLDEIAERIVRVNVPYVVAPSRIQ
jgi:hypothetical protein